MLLDNYCNTHGRLVSKQRRPTAVAQFLNNFSLEERHTVTNILLSLGLRMYGCAVPSTPADISTLRSALDMELVVRARGRDEGTKAIAAVATHSSGCPNSSPDAEQRHLAPGPNAQEAFTLVDGEPLPRPFAVAANNETVRSTPTQPNSGDIPDAEEGHANDTEGAKFETKHQESEAMYGFGEQARRGNAGEQRSVDHLNSEYPADAGVEIKQGGCRTALDFVIREALSLSLGDHAPIIHVHPEGVGLTPSSPSTSPSANALNLQTAECSLEPGEVSEKKTVALQKTLSSSSSALPPLFCNNVEVYPMDFCKSLIRHIELTNGVRQNPILVAASLPQSLAVFTLYSSFSSLYKSLLVSYHVSAATGNTGARTLTFVTSNAGKLREVQACLAGHIVVDAIKLDLPELQCCSVAEVSRNKALTAFERLKRPVLVEDTGLCFEALGGMPGPYVRWFIDSIGADGLARLLHGFDSRRAYTECVFTYCAAPDLLLQFHGRADGTISREPRGSGGFGFDCIFQPDEGDGRTFAEMSDSAKNEISHRSKALAALRKHFDHPAG